jgi:hypothetical protein
MSRAVRQMDRTWVKNCSSDRGERLAGLQGQGALVGLGQQALQGQVAPGDRPQLQEHAHALDVFLDTADLFDAQKEEGPAAQAAQVHLVEEAVEQVGPAADLVGQGVEGLAHGHAVAALDDGDDVVVVAELGQVLLPALLRFLVGAEQVVALRLVLQSGGGGEGGQGAQEEGDGQDGARKAAGQRHQPDEEAPDGSRSSRGDWFRRHGIRLPLGSRARAVHGRRDGGL